MIYRLLLLAFLVTSCAAPKQSYHTPAHRPAYFIIPTKPAQK
jgi:hypothetical protein